MSDHPPAPTDAEVEALGKALEAGAPRISSMPRDDWWKALARLALIRDRQQHAAATAAAVMAEREKTLRKAAEVARCCFDDRNRSRNGCTDYVDGHNDATREAKAAILAIIPTPSPERGDAQQGGQANGE